MQLSARGVAGEKQRGRKKESIRWYGSQAGSVRLSDRKLRVRKPRLREKGPGKGRQVEIPAYEAINASGKLGDRVLEILMANVSTRNYARVIPEMADTVGISKSSVSRNFIEQSGRELKRLTERRFDEREFLVIYLDGVKFGEHHVLCAVGVDSEGEKVVLGVKDGASENGATTTALLEDLVERGIDSSRRYLFVIDDSKALRSAIDRVFGPSNPIQRCRNHKLRNVTSKLPEDLANQMRWVMKAAFRLPWKEGIAKLRKQAEWLRPHHPDAAASLEEGLEEGRVSPFFRQKIGQSKLYSHCLKLMCDSPRRRRCEKCGKAERFLRGFSKHLWESVFFVDSHKRGIFHNAAHRRRKKSGQDRV